MVVATSDVTKLKIVVSISTTTGSQAVDLRSMGAIDRRPEPLESRHQNLIS
jgi:hypothetical protein